jgi:hypothetical protein
MIFPLRRKSPSILIKNMTVGMPFSVSHHFDKTYKSGDVALLFDKTYKYGDAAKRYPLEAAPPPF